MAAQIPALLMGVANINQGIAKEQMRAWMFRIESLREEIEKVIETKIFSKVLEANGIDAHVEIIWGLPSDEEKNNKLNIVTELLKNPMLDESFRVELELQAAELLNIPQENLETDREEREREEKEPLPKVPEQALVKPSKSPHGSGIATGLPLEKCTYEKYYAEEDYEKLDNMTIREWVNFDYNEYSQDVIDFVNTDRFADLRATTKEQLKAGLLSSNNIEQLRLSLHDAFIGNISIKELSQMLNKRIAFKNRYVLKNGVMLKKNGKPVLAVSASKRAIMIARTETVRASNSGALINYKKNGIKEVRWVSALSNRTCEYCAAQNGIVYPVDSGVQPPLHMMCRCTLVPVVKE